MEEEFQGEGWMEAEWPGETSHERQRDRGGSVRSAGLEAPAEGRAGNICR